MLNEEDSFIYHLSFTIKTMKTKLLMMASALVSGISGVILEFLPHEVLSFYGANADNFSAVLVQIAGASLFGFAVMNWMAKTVLIGGIYARPLALGNFVHFMVGALALIKFAFSAGVHWSIWIAAVVYAVFAVLFGIVFMTHPSRQSDKT